MSQGTHDPSGPIALDPTEVAPATQGTEPVVPSAHGLRSGEHIGRYVIERQVGRGGMGVVYAAHDPQLDRRVAIKVLHAGAGATELATRMVREAIALAKLQHPNVVAAYDAGEIDGRVFVAMQYVEGRTLAAYLADDRPAWKEIVRIFVAAGRGLAAAHEAGLVHRDVKPGNILVDEGGGVHVTDFGLARAADADDEEEIGHGHGHGHGHGDSLLSTPMTQAGVIVGTPAYMAPEQFLGQKITARSDQFSFCVALWEAVYGQHPFLVPRPDETAMAARARLADAVVTGAVVAPPAGKKVPRWLHRAIRRGLEVDPERRFPTMTALIAAIAPLPHRNPVVIGAIALAAAAGGATIALGASGGSSPPSCAAVAGERVATAWNADRRAALGASFAASGRPYADKAAAQATAALDAYATNWKELRADACQAARDRADETQLLAERRFRCLDARLTALDVVAGMFAGDAQPEFIDQVERMVGGLPSLADCADEEALLAGVAPPAPELAPRVTALEGRLAEARARRDAGQLREAKALLEALRLDATAVGYAPVQVGVDATLGDVAMMDQDRGALDHYLLAIEVATRHRLDRELARATANALPAAGLADRPDAFATLLPIARALAARAGDPELDVELKVRHGRALVRIRRWQDAIAVCREALAAAEALWGKEDPRLVPALDCNIEALVPLDRADEALSVVERALALRRAQYGDAHPAVADYLAALARLYDVLGRADERRKLVEDARAIRERVFGPEHVRIVDSLLDVADLEVDAYHHAEAKELLLRALAIAEKTAGPDARLTGRVHLQLGQTATFTQDHDAARTHLDRAREILEQTTGPRSLELAGVLIFHGQALGFRGETDRAVVMLERAVSILDEHDDHRALIARGALGNALLAAKRWEAAVPVLERALAGDLKNVAPANRVLLRVNLARALRGARREPARVAELVAAARAEIDAAGGQLDGYREMVDGVAK